MGDPKQAAGLQARLKSEIRAAHDAAKSPLSSDQVATIVRQVMASLDGDVSAADLHFYSQLEELARYIHDAKSEIATIRPKDISTDFIPSATDELDAVVGATEEATNKIMDVCEEINAVVETLDPAMKDKLVGCTTKIFEACNFQDITGQRINKVVQTLKHIDAKITALVRAMGDEIQQSGGDLPAAQPDAADPEKGLLNGPQLSGAGVSQEEIDRMMSGK